MSDLTAERLRSLLSYCRLTGEFRWRVAKDRSIKPGDLAGNMRPNGYVIIGIDGRYYVAHRLAWLHVTGEWPKSQLDHRDLNKSNNRFVNLREATMSQNCANKRCQSNNLCGVKGVTRVGGRYYARIRKHGILHHLGSFATAEEAGAAYLQAAHRLFGEFARAS